MEPQPPNQEVLAGLVERVTYHNAENGFSARQTCLCGALRSRASAARRRRSAGLRVMEIPVRIGQTRTCRVRRESLPGFKCQIGSTSGTFNINYIYGRVPDRLRAIPCG